MSEYEREKRVSLHHREEEEALRAEEVEGTGDADADDEEPGTELDGGHRLAE